MALDGKEDRELNLLLKAPGRRFGRRSFLQVAGLLGAAVRFKQLVDREQLEPDRENGAPRCMWEYSRVCTSTRIPGATRDVLEQYPGSRHVVVVRDDHFSSLDVLDGAGRAYAVEDLERALQRIVDDVATPGPPVGVLTTDSRRAWARVRDQHLRHGSGPARELLAAVETAILVLVLESGPAPAHPRSSEAARLFLHGDARGRWFDKSIQLVVAANGVSGYCMEHAGFDGSTAVRFAEFLAENDRMERADLHHHGVRTDEEVDGDLLAVDVALRLEHALERKLEIFQMLVGQLKARRQAADHKSRDAVERLRVRDRERDRISAQRLGHLRAARPRSPARAARRPRAPSRRRGAGSCEHGGTRTHA